MKAIGFGYLHDTDTIRHPKMLHVESVNQSIHIKVQDFYIAITLHKSIKKSDVQHGNPNRHFD